MNSAASAPSQAAYSKPGFGNARPAARWSGLTQNRRGRVSPPTVAYDRLLGEQRAFETFGPTGWNAPASRQSQTLSRASCSKTQSGIGLSSCGQVLSSTQMQWRLLMISGTKHIPCQGEFVFY